MALVAVRQQLQGCLLENRERIVKERWEPADGCTGQGMTRQGKAVGVGWWREGRR